MSQGVVSAHLLVTRDSGITSVAAIFKGGQADPARGQRVGVSASVIEVAMAREVSLLPVGADLEA